MADLRGFRVFRTVCRLTNFTRAYARAGKGKAGLAGRGLCGEFMDERKQNKSYIARGAALAVRWFESSPVRNL